MCAYYYSYIGGGEVPRRSEKSRCFGETGEEPRRSEIPRRFGGELEGAKTVRSDLALFSRFFQRTLVLRWLKTARWKLRSMIFLGP